MWFMFYVIITFICCLTHDNHKKSYLILDCPAPPTIPNGNVEGNPPYDDDENITYTCSTNYALLGSDTNTCKGPLDYDWTLTDSALPSCLRGKLIIFEISLGYSC